MGSFQKICTGGIFVLAITIAACTTANQRGNNTSDVLGSSLTPENPQAVLASQSNLQPDTIEAALHNRGQSKIAYIGVWASSPDGCRLIDQGVYDGFAVITTNHIRTFEEVCQVTTRPMLQNPETLDALCSAEGQASKSRMTIEMVNSQSMKLKHEGTSGFNLTRCHLPK